MVADNPAGKTLGSSGEKKLPVLSYSRPGPESISDEAESAARAGVAQAYGRLPLSFEANQGQADPRVKFLSHGSDYALFLTPNESVLVLNGPVPEDSAAVRENRSEVKRQRAVLRMKLAGANPLPEVEGLDEREGKTNYFIGKDASKWRTNVARFARVQYRGVYPGVDLIYYGSRERIEFDFVVAGGADFRKIRLEIKGAKKMRLDVTGDLVLTTSVGEVRQYLSLIHI